ncbi:Inositol-1-monophosphatase [compost metagenome]
MNGKPLKVATTSELKQSLLATGFVAEHENVIAEQMKVFNDIVRKCRGVRRPGAAAYDLALVARGVFDGYWERNIQPWDAAAGILLVREAGGEVITYRGDRYNPYKNSIIAGNTKVVKAVQEVILSHISAETH